MKKSVKKRSSRQKRTRKISKPDPNVRPLSSWITKSHNDSAELKQVKSQSIDKENCASILDHFPEQVREASVLGRDLAFSAIRHVVICGMGGSGLPGNIITSLVDTRIPIFIIKDYSLPNYVDNYSLVFIISYSGNTEETLSAYEEAKKRNARLIVITSGGELAVKAKEQGIPIIHVHSGYQPRMAFGFQTIPILNVLEKCGLVRPIDWNKVADFLKKEASDIKKQSKEASHEIGKRIPLIYSSTDFFSAAYKWKIDFNENAKIHAFANTFPEFNHNEINGYTNKNGEYIVIILRDRDDHPQIRKRMEIVADLIKKSNTPVITIDSKGPDAATRLMYAIWLGDWVSYYTALALNTDPTPVKIIEDLKKALTE